MSTPENKTTQLSIDLGGWHKVFIQKKHVTCVIFNVFAAVVHVRIIVQQGPYSLILIGGNG